ncbi:MAG: hypothetical protein JNK87_03470 [Bryobacterales bacterium]|nr:hypothetical protein [Bryobacterales bacterium]
MPRIPLLALFAVTLLPPPHVSAADTWLRIQTDHFELYTTAGERTGKDAILYFEQLRTFFRQITNQPVDAPAELPVRIFAFRNEKEFAPFRTKEGIAGYFLPGPDRNSIVLMRASQEHYPTVIHEYMHLLINSLVGTEKMPIWLNEGYADLFTTLKPMGKQVQVGQFIPSLLYQIQQSKWIDLGDLLRADHKSPYYNEQDRMGMFYAQSWLLVHMLMLGDDYRPKYSDFLAKVFTGDPVEALQTVYGRDLKRIGDDLRSYAKSDRIKVAMYDVKLSKAAEIPKVEPVDAATVAVALANLEVGIGKYAAAKARLQSVDTSGRWDAPETLAYLEWRSGNADLAMEHMAKAIAAGCPNAKLYTDYARLMATSSQPRPKVLQALEQALQRTPNDFDLRMETARLMLLEKRQYQALAALNQIKAVKEEQAARFFRLISWTQYLCKQPEAALQSATLARRFAKDPSEQGELDRFIAHLKDPAAGQPTEAAVATAERPQLRREGPRPPGDVEPLPPQLPQAEGSLTAMECLGKQARLHVTTAEGQRIFTIDDPNRIVIRSGGRGTVEFTCGPQNPPKKIIVEYTPEEGGGQSAGVVTALEFP